MQKMSQEEPGPFSMELAYQVYQKNVECTDQLLKSIVADAENGASETALLLTAVDAIAKLTDNTILKAVIEKSILSR